MCLSLYKRITPIKGVIPKGGAKVGNIPTLPF
nr:MAG TPA: hypothetical protein [Caudoviricetes sp.]